MQETGGLSQNRTVTIAYRESSPRQTQRRLCGVTIQTSCFDSGTSPTRSVGVSEVYVYRHIRQMGECPSMRFSLLRSISIGPGNRSIFAPRKPMQNVHPCAFRLRVQSLLVHKIVQFLGESRVHSQNGFTDNCILTRLRFASQTSAWRVTACSMQTFYFAHTARFLVKMVYHTTPREKCAVRAFCTPRTAFSASGLA